jgi:uroporphyrinogen III methyltransferase/synthase
VIAGRRILVARARPGASELAARLRALGAQVVEAPDVAVAPLRQFAALDGALDSTAQNAADRRFDAVVFGCAAGVDAALARGRAIAVPVVAIGKQADARLRATGSAPRLFVPGACRDAVGAQAALLAGRLLLVTDEEGRPSLAAELRALGATVEVVPAYRTVRRWPADARGPFDLIVVPSSSAARAVFGGDAGAALRDARTIALGPQAAAAARALGATRVELAATDTIDAAVARAEELA